MVFLGDGGVMDTAAEKERELVRQRLQERSVRKSVIIGINVVE